VLKGVDPLLSGDLLKLLDDMGHGDELVLADRNFPAYSMGLPVVRLGEVGVVRAARALFSVFPLDTFVPHPLARMQKGDDPAAVPAAAAKVLQLAIDAEERVLEFEVIPRLDFYERASGAFAVVHTLEDEGYNDFVLTKGVV
jgi:L-fucose mutarotase